MSQLVTHTSTLHQGRQLNKLQDLARHEVCTQCLKLNIWVCSSTLHFIQGCVLFDQKGVAYLNFVYKQTSCVNYQT